MRDLFRIMKVKHIIINCLQSNKKQQILLNISAGLNRMFGSSVKESTKMRLFVNHLQLLKDQLKAKGLFDFEREQFYIVFDNFEKISVNDKFVSALFNIKKSLSINFNICLVGVNIMDQKLISKYTLSLIPQIALNPPDQSYQRDVLTELIAEKIEENDIWRDVFESIGRELVMDIVSNFGVIITDLGILLHLGLQIFQVVAEYAKKEKDPRKILVSRNYKALKKILLENPYLCEGNKEVLMQKVMDQQSKDILQINIEKGRGTVIKLPRIPAIILIACWIGNRNQEKTDKKLFKDYKKKGKRVKKVIEEGIVIKKIRLERIVALAQSLISLKLEESSHENTAFDQTIDFYSQLAALEEMGFVTKFTSKADELQNLKFICNLDQASIIQIGQQHNIQIQEFLKQ